MLYRISSSNKNLGEMYYFCPKTKKTEDKTTWDWGCNFFLWARDLRLCPCGQGPCRVISKQDLRKKNYKCSREGDKNCQFIEVVEEEAEPSSLSPGVLRDSCSPASAKSGGSAASASRDGYFSSKRCKNCKLLDMKVNLLETKLEILRSPEKHANSTSAAFVEALEELGDSVNELMLDP